MNSQIPEFRVIGLWW